MFEPMRKMPQISMMDGERDSTALPQNNPPHFQGISAGKNLAGDPFLISRKLKTRHTQKMFPIKKKKNTLLA
jgi:hypothetical protein